MIMNKNIYYNGLPFKVNKGSDGLYRFEVEDAGLNRLNQSFDNFNKKVPAPYTPSLVNPRVEPLTDSLVPKWIKDGVIYLTRMGSSQRGVFKSEDNLQTVTQIADLTDLNTSSFSTGALLVTGTNRIIISASNGDVIVSDENQDNFEVKFTFTCRGYAQWHLAHSQHENIVLLATYDTTLASDPPRQVALSKDYGETWDIIFDKPIGEMLNAERYHIHDVEYDPYSGRIYVAIGDDLNTEIHYSDDFGETWNSIFGSRDNPYNKQVTQILSFPHGIILGSDGEPDGLGYIPRRTDVIRWDIEDKEVIKNYLLFNNKNEFKHFATRRWQIRDGNHPVTLLPFRVDTSRADIKGAASVLLATTDGINWYEVYRHYNNDSGLQNIMYNPNDGEVYGVFQGGGSVQMFRAKLILPN